MDYMAIISYGSYPTPTPTEDQRAGYAASYGFLDSLSESTAVTVVNRILEIGKAGIRMAKGILRIG